MEWVIAWAIACAVGLWSFGATDDYVGWPAVVAIAHLLLWFGLRDDDEETRLRRRLATAISAAGPLISPYLVALSFGVGGLEGFDGLVIGLFIGGPIALVVAGVIVFWMTAAPPETAAWRIWTAAAIAVGFAWVLAAIRAVLPGVPERAIDVWIVPLVAMMWLVPALVIVKRAPVS